MTDLILPQPKDAVHKAWLYRTLTSISSDSWLATVLAFKGGTCAAMLGYLDRFSIDLDFDLIAGKKSWPKTRARLERVFRDLGLVIHDQSHSVPQYFLKYEAPPGERNTLKIDVAVAPPKANQYESKRFREIDRILGCQTIETMVANKLVALVDRYRHAEAIAGRDLYDIHHFLLQGYRYREAVILERTGQATGPFLTDLIDFITRHITSEILDQDLNMLLPYEQFSRIRKILKPETLMLLSDELKRIELTK